MFKIHKFASMTYESRDIKFSVFLSRTSDKVFVSGKCGLLQVFYEIEVHTAKNTVISSDFLVWKFCGKTQFPHQEIMWNCGIFRSVKVCGKTPI